MVLTLMRLWMAIDQLATFELPLLLQYSPEIAENVLEVLLLRTSSHVDEARVIQQYLRSRHERAFSNPSILSNEVSPYCFAAQYFSQSYHLQSLKEFIEHDAQRKRDEKCRELQKLNREYATLDRQAKQLYHHFVINRWGKRVHDWDCERCSVERARDELRIDLHEWPLPSRKLEAEMVVFELGPPEIFMVWRDTTFGILHDLGSTHMNHDDDSKAYIDLESYDGLNQWIIPTEYSPRVTLGSATKPFTMAHYSSTKLRANEERVCVTNGLTFQLYDKETETWASGPFDDASFTKFGTFKLPHNSPYRHLRYAVEGTSHSSNRVISDQFDCPKELSLHEHMAFGSLRSGPRLQWMNIARGLEEDILTFSSEEAKILHAQAAWQIGKMDDQGLREWHKELQDSKFGKLLVHQSRELLKRIEANWLEATSLYIVVLLVSRLLASPGTRDAVARDAYTFLREARHVALKWLHLLQIKLQSAEKDSDILDYQNRVCEMAAICRSTFDVDPCHIGSIMETPEDFSAFIKSFISLHDNQPPDSRNAPTSLQILLCRDHRLSHRVLPHIHQVLYTNSHILCTAISEIWPHYNAGPNGWRVLRTPNNRWVSTTTAAGERYTSQKVHLNLLRGQLLIDGKPLGRLPQEYVQDPMYIRLFGRKTLDVVPASAPGMTFTTRSLVHGYEVSFTRTGRENQLVIQAYKDGHTYELIPHSRLSNDLPRFLSADYHHWAHLGKKIVEFRLLKNPWCSSSRQWDLCFAEKKFTLQSVGNSSKHVFLVDQHSSLFQSLCRRLSTLELPRYLHVTQTTSPELHINVELPRMSISFFMNQEKDLESSNFRGQIIDPNQSIGTMYGLKNQLVLCPKDAMARSLPRSRSVLIPHGDIQFAKKEYHVSVIIQPGSSRKVVFYRYLIDTDLGYLVSDAGLTSRLLKIYLHALTSHCLPDPLTKRTGTEEALSQLFEPASSSFETIDEPQARLLRLIGLLTPKREYYPANLTCMQKTHWANLPSLSQHFAFSVATSNVLVRAATLQLFHSKDVVLKDYMVTLENNLLKRATSRTNMYYPLDETDFKEYIIGSTHVQDKAYTGRDDKTFTWQDEGEDAAWASYLAIQNWGQAFYRHCDLVTLMESWKTVEGPSELLELTYSSEWLNIELSTNWLTIYNLCRQADTLSNKYAFSACLAAAAFSQRVSMDLVAVLISFATNPTFRLLAPPQSPSFDLNDGYQPVASRVEELIKGTALDIEDTPLSVIDIDFDWPDDVSDSELRESRRESYNKSIEKHAAEFAQSLISQWSSAHLQVMSPAYRSWFKVEDCLTGVWSYFISVNQNVKLRKHLQEIELVLFSHPTSDATNFDITLIHSSRPPSVPYTTSNPLRQLRLASLMGARACPQFEKKQLQSEIPISRSSGLATDTSGLLGLFNELKQGSRPLNRRYVDELDESRQDLAAKPPSPLLADLPPLELLVNRGRERHSHLKTRFKQLRSSLAPSTTMDRVIYAAGIWPRITPRTLLHRLTFKARSRSDAWRAGLIGYARAFIEYQQSQRLVSLAKLDNAEEFYKEVDSAEGDSSIEACHPDWLLVQIDGNFSVRSIQRQVAQEMISPLSRQNTVLQLNMGEGKSSVIVPIIAASLADATQLVRVVVLKPLWRQMFYLLINRLSGLVHRRIYYLPFGRQIRVDAPTAQQLKGLYDECMREGGILLAQPEHILSFKLMGIDQLLTYSTPKELSTAKQLQDMQGWLTKNARDILDESDEILHVRYQLVYTVGEQQALEDHPDRWTTTQQLLQLAAFRISQLRHESSRSVKYECKRPGQFPLIRIMPDCDNVIEQELISAIAQDVLMGRIPNLNFSRLTLTVRQLAFQFLTEKVFKYQNYRSLERSCDPAMWKGLLLVRGLLASGIMVFALKHKHYRVDYGLDLSRSLLAVPYRAKDIPSLRAEFGHPDMAVVLTCLSYYYKGLTSEQLDTCFQLLSRLDNPILEYEEWVGRNSDMPTDLRQLGGVNIKDREQFRERIIPAFAHNAAVVNFFLSSVVFPKAAKEFPHKLSTSGWDLAEPRSHVTTGFSGTNDNRYLLPTSITQEDPVKQLSTNALVLTYLLQPINNHYLPMRGGTDAALSTKGFLELLVRQEPEIRVLLDVGAQMLELQNQELVECWLALRPDVEAAVYFNDKDELVVLPQRGTPSSLYSSPFAEQLDKCIIYLDDGHTRGTDLKLPRDYRALVTLGPKVTKDRLLQGCMRMRNLGHGQSVIFSAPPEIDRQIRAPTQLAPDSPVEALDVLRWAMLETCKDLQHHVSHWARQGLDYKRRAESERRYNVLPEVSLLKEGWMKPESRSLQDMYGVRSPAEISQHNRFTQEVFNDPNLGGRLRDLGIEKLDDSNVDEEQERELSHEVEEEQELERPPKRKPATYELHLDVENFIKTGIIYQGSKGLVPLFRPFQSFGTQLLVPWSPHLYASTDFLRTLEIGRSGGLDDYMRPVNWIVQGPGKILLVLSPQEVNELLPLIRRSRLLQLHVYAPRVTQSMRSFSNLDFYSLPSRSTPPPSIVPSPTQFQLDLFAGQLYLSSHQEFLTLCAFLGLFTLPTDQDEQLDVQVESDGFVKPEHRTKLVQYDAGYAVCKFASSPIPLLKELFGRRRKGMNYLRTHIGHLLHARNLTQNDF